MLQVRHGKVRHVKLLQAIAASQFDLIFLPRRRLLSNGHNNLLTLLYRTPASLLFTTTRESVSDPTLFWWSVCTPKRKDSPPASTVHPRNLQNTDINCDQAGVIVTAAFTFMMPKR